MGFFSERSLIGVAFSGLKPVRRWIVLDHITVPVYHPQRPIWSDLRTNRRRPFIIARQKTSTIMRHEICSARLKVKLAKQMAGRLGYKLHFVPIFFGKASRCIKRAPG